MDEQRDRAKADARAKKAQHGDAAAYREVADALGRAVEFTGYDEVVSEATVRGLVAAGGGRRRRRTRATRSSSCSTAPRSTPRAAASSPTRACIELANGARVEVLDVQSPITGLIVHQARVLVRRGHASATPAQALVDVERRRSISRAHTATHMVHKAFREALGETATQAGLGERARALPLRLLRHRRGARPRCSPTSRRGSTTWSSPTCRCTPR